MVIANPPKMVYDESGRLVEVILAMPVGRYKIERR
jgi:hypothetical protein